jgi:hypothetical protein
VSQVVSSVYLPTQSALVNPHPLAVVTQSLVPLATAAGPAMIGRAVACGFTVSGPMGAGVSVIVPVIGFDGVRITSSASAGPVDSNRAAAASARGPRDDGDMVRTLLACGSAVGRPILSNGEIRQRQVRSASGRTSS